MIGKYFFYHTAEFGRIFIKRCRYHWV